MRYFLEISYNGRAYNGWQVQENAPSVQQAVQEALGRLARCEVNVTGAGRTDSGVHAARYVAHFDIAEPVADTAEFVYRLNAILPNDIAALGLKRVNDTAHARFDALSREYEYYIFNRKNPFHRDTSWQYYVPLNTDEMNRAAEYLLRASDFTTFSKLHSGNKTNICKVEVAQWRADNDGFVFTIRADRFLRNMVRSIVGTLVDVGRGRLTVEQFGEILNSADRSRASGSAPAQGLFFTNVEYPDSIYKID